MEERRGRPKLITKEDLPRQFTRVYKDPDCISYWRYDLDLFPNGPIEVINEWIEEPKVQEDEIAKINEKLPKTKRKYLNPKNGKWVAYTRAKMLGLVS